MIAYQQMREIEADIIRRLKVEDSATRIKLENFYGIEIKSFPVEIAKLSLLIAEFQCDVRYRGERLACLNVLPLHRTGQIRVGNALQLNWLEVCPPPQKAVEQWDLGGPTGRLALEESGVNKAEEVETYICGNPPYVGGKKQNPAQKRDMSLVFANEDKHKNLDYICGFIVKACSFLDYATKFAFVATNSISQGTHVPVLWPIIFKYGAIVEFAYETFKWANNAQRNAGVSCTIIGLTKRPLNKRYIYGDSTRRQVSNVSPYLIEGSNTIVSSRSAPGSALSPMITGNAAYDGGNLFVTVDEARALLRKYPEINRILRRTSGTSEFVDGSVRYCLWIDDCDLAFARSIPEISTRIDAVLEYRKNGGEVATTLVARPHQFRYRNTSDNHQLIVSQVSSERREYLPAGLLEHDVIITHLAHAIYHPTLVDFAILASRLHLAWVATICGKFKTDYRYSSNLGWNTFPMPNLTDKNRADLTRCAENILLAREAHFPASIADLYDPSGMPDDLRRAHDLNDEVLERIYIGRRFRNDTERLEKLLDLYSRTIGALPYKDVASNANRKAKANS